MYCESPVQSSHKMILKSRELTGEIHAGRVCQTHYLFITEARAKMKTAPSKRPARVKDSLSKPRFTPFDYGFRRK